MSEEHHKRDEPSYGDWQPGVSYRAQQHESDSTSSSQSSVSDRIRNSVSFASRYLSSTEPAIILIHASVVFVASQLLAFIAYRILLHTSMSSFDSEITLSTDAGIVVNGVSSMLITFAAALALWSVARLIADAIREKA